MTKEQLTLNNRYIQILASTLKIKAHFTIDYALNEIKVELRQNSVNATYRTSNESSTTIIGAVRGPHKKGTQKTKIRSSSFSSAFTGTKKSATVSAPRESLVLYCKVKSVDAGAASLSIQC